LLWVEQEDELACVASHEMKSTECMHIVTGIIIHETGMSLVYYHKMRLPTSCHHFLRVLNANNRSVFVI